MKSYSITIFILFPLFIIFSCSREIHQPKEEILAKVGKKSISVNEFIRRAEYTIRPPYCRGDNYVHKKIVLNSLIAEKLLALEAEKDKDNELVRNEQFQDYLRGRKEQAMRQWLYYHDFYEKVSLNTNELKKNYKLAGREYKIAYLTIKDSTIVNQVQQRLKEGASLDELFKKFGNVREVGYGSSEDETIHDVLFSKPLEKEQIIGPLEIEDNYYIYIKVLGWTDRLAVSNLDVHQRWKDVADKLRERDAGILYRQYIGKIMRGKKVEFNKDIFFKLVDIVGPYYLKSKKEKERAFNQKFWGENKKNISSDVGNEIEEIKNHPLLKIEGEVWTVEDFIKELNSHPLVFRKRKMKKSEFAEQLKLAIVDLIRDKYITKEAYKKGYDKVNIVRRYMNMWKDYLLAIYQRNKYLELIGEKRNFYKEYPRILEQNLNPYINQLQKKNNDVIEINTDRFEEIKLTRIDMFVLQKNVPFPIVVPSFPILTTYNKLDYGEKMN